MRAPRYINRGDLEIYKFKNGKPYGFRKCESAARYVEYVKTIKYDRNLFVLFINSINSTWVTVRSLTNCLDTLLNLVGEVKKPFDTSPYQELPQKYLKPGGCDEKVPLVRS